MNLGSDRPWLALDVGGANIKASHESGHAQSHSFELWKNPADLTRVLSNLATEFPPSSRIALTMTAELCDCFATKAEGVLYVLKATSDAFPGLPISVWCVDGRFRDVNAVRSEPRLAAASNWLALAEVAARVIPTGPGLLIDIGSTTSDLIPLADGRALPRGLTDTDRLRTGELVYAGGRRTPVCALAAELPFRGMMTGLAAELFATTLDVYLTLGEIPADSGDHATADGRPATPGAALARLARMVCADPDEFTADDAVELARSADSALLARLESAARGACESTVGPPAFAIVSGSGEPLARRLAERLLGPSDPIVCLRDAWGPAASSAACAHALVVLARERGTVSEDIPTRATSP
jgi:probable H4MPT-linked C1 transfer pathway protein